eukprot:NODE_966_length_1201_cov_220.945312_g732_i0.p1 GENE.NODE_966_length_1201_cov_220.945312_g732_i0~~NODE_966_length_1201_cov_220.945312_g732_i0.p1  ORF type:complete len:301 (+),score=-30.91 NODE_966_length_1201_cov_220.945312_g732_i0:214-1116(+)
MLRNNNNSREKAARKIQRFFRKNKRQSRSSNQNPDSRSIPQSVMRQSRFWKRTYDFENYISPTVIVQQTSGYFPVGFMDTGFAYCCLQIPFALDGGTDTIPNQGFTLPALLPNRSALAGEFDEYNLSYINVEVIPQVDFFPPPQLPDDGALGSGYAYGSKAKHGFARDTNSANTGFFCTGNTSSSSATVAQGVATQNNFYSYTDKNVTLNIKVLRFKYYPSTLGAPSSFPGYPTVNYSPTYQLYNLWFPIGAASAPPLGLLTYFHDLIPVYCGGGGFTQGVAVLTFTLNVRMHFTFRKYR